MAQSESNAGVQMKTGSDIQMQTHQSNSVEGDYDAEIFEEDDQSLCRICRGPGTESNALNYPCKCRGSIKYVHKQCLENWLKQTGKNSCEICKHQYSFTPIYKENMPSEIPWYLVAYSCSIKALLNLGWLLRVLLCISLWVFIVPKVVIILLKSVFLLYEGYSFEISEMINQRFSVRGVIVDLIQGPVLCVFLGFWAYMSLNMLSTFFSLVGFTYNCVKWNRRHRQIRILGQYMDRYYPRQPLNKAEGDKHSNLRRLKPNKVRRMASRLKTEFEMRRRRHEFSQNVHSSPQAHKAIFEPEGGTSSTYKFPFRPNSRTDVGYMMEMYFNQMENGSNDQRELHKHQDSRHSTSLKGAYAMDQNKGAQPTQTGNSEAQNVKELSHERNTITGGPSRQQSSYNYETIAGTGGSKSQHVRQASATDNLHAEADTTLAEMQACSGAVQSSAAGSSLAALDKLALDKQQQSSITLTGDRKVQQQPNAQAASSIEQVGQHSMQGAFNENIYQNTKQGYPKQFVGGIKTAPHTQEASSSGQTHTNQFSFPQPNTSSSQDNQKQKQIMGPQYSITQSQQDKEKAQIGEHGQIGQGSTGGVFDPPQELRDMASPDFQHENVYNDRQLGVGQDFIGPQHSTHPAAIPELGVHSTSKDVPVWKTHQMRRGVSKASKKGAQVMSQNDQRRAQQFYMYDKRKRLLANGGEVTRESTTNQSWSQRGVLGLLQRKDLMYKVKTHDDGVGVAYLLKELIGEMEQTETEREAARMRQLQVQQQQQQIQQQLQQQMMDVRAVGEELRANRDEVAEQEEARQRNVGEEEQRKSAESVRVEAKGSNSGIENSGDNLGTRGDGGVVSKRGDVSGQPVEAHAASKGGFSSELEHGHVGSGRNMQSNSAGQEGSGVASEFKKQGSGIAEQASKQGQQTSREGLAYHSREDANFSNDHAEVDMASRGHDRQDVLLNQGAHGGGQVGEQNESTSITMNTNENRVGASGDLGGYLSGEGSSDDSGDEDEAAQFDMQNQGAAVAVLNREQGNGGEPVLDQMQVTGSTEQEANQQNMQGSLVGESVEQQHEQQRSTPNQGDTQYQVTSNPPSPHHRNTTAQSMEAPINPVPDHVQNMIQELPNRARDMPRHHIDPDHNNFPNNPEQHPQNQEAQQDQGAAAAAAAAAELEAAARGDGGPAEVLLDLDIIDIMGLRGNVVACLIGIFLVLACLLVAIIILVALPMSIAYFIVATRYNVAITHAPRIAALYKPVMQTGYPYILRRSAGAAIQAASYVERFVIPEETFKVEYLGYPGVLINSAFKPAQCTPEPPRDAFVASHLLLRKCPTPQHSHPSLQRVFASFVNVSYNTDISRQPFIIFNMTHMLSHTLPTVKSPFMETLWTNVFPTESLALSDNTTQYFSQQLLSLQQLVKRSPEPRTARQPSSTDPQRTAVDGHSQSTNSKDSVSEASNARGSWLAQAINRQLMRLDKQLMNLDSHTLPAEYFVLPGPMSITLLMYGYYEIILHLLTLHGLYLIYHIVSSYDHLATFTYQLKWFELNKLYLNSITCDHLKRQNRRPHELMGRKWASLAEGEAWLQSLNALPKDRAQACADKAGNSGTGQSSSENTGTVPSTDANNISWKGASTTHQYIGETMNNKAASRLAPKEQGGTIRGLLAKWPFGPNPFNPPRISNTVDTSPVIFQSPPNMAYTSPAPQFKLAPAPTFNGIVLSHDLHNYLLTRARISSARGMLQILGGFSTGFTQQLQQYYLDVKVMVMASVVILWLPLVFGFWIDICATPLTHFHMSDRIKVLTTYPALSAFIYFVIGFVFTLNTVNMITVARQVLRRDALPFLRDPNREDFNPFDEIRNRGLLEHIQWTCTQVVLHQFLGFVFINFPINVAMFINPNWLPVQIHLSSSLLQIPLDLLVFQLILPLIFQHIHIDALSVMFAREWFRWVGRLLNMEEYLLPEQYLTETMRERVEQAAQEEEEEEGGEQGVQEGQRDEQGGLDVDGEEAAVEVEQQGVDDQVLKTVDNGAGAGAHDGAVKQSGDGDLVGDVATGSSSGAAVVQQPAKPGALQADVQTSNTQGTATDSTQTTLPTDAPAPEQPTQEEPPAQLDLSGMDLALDDDDDFEQGDDSATHEHDSTRSPRASLPTIDQRIAAITSSPSFRTRISLLILLWAASTVVLVTLVLIGPITLGRSMCKALGLTWASDVQAESIGLVVLALLWLSVKRVYDNLMTDEKWLKRTASQVWKLVVKLAQFGVMIGVAGVLCTLLAGMLVDWLLLPLRPGNVYVKWKLYPYSHWLTGLLSLKLAHSLVLMWPQEPNRPFAENSWRARLEAAGQRGITNLDFKQTMLTIILPLLFDLVLIVLGPIGLLIVMHSVLSVPLLVCLDGWRYMYLLTIAWYAFHWIWEQLITNVHKVKETVRDDWFTVGRELQNYSQT